MKMTSEKRGWVLVFCGVLLLLAAGTRHKSLIEMRRARHLQQVSPEKTTPLVAITTVAFGGFRGLVADALWVRANKMQEEGQYFEMVQLAKWISELEPRVPEVWSFQAWNLAYNISVLFPEFEDRWRWVNHGLDLLRKQGLTENPNSPDLHWDIGWMFQHKIGMNFDLAHHLYEQKLREQVEALLPNGVFNEKNIALKTLQAIRDNFVMDPDFMQELENRYGPLDWRLPSTHALYWSARGLTFTPLDKMDDRRLHRMQMQSLAQLTRGGRLVVSADRQTWIKLPRLDLIQPVIAQYESLLAKSPYNHYLQLGFSNFLNDAVILNADYGNLPESYTLYEKLAGVEDKFPSGQENFQRYIKHEITKNPMELNYDGAMSRIVALITQSLDANSNPESSRRFMQMAEQVHRIYQQGRVSKEHMERTGLPPFDTIVTLVKKSKKT